MKRRANERKTTAAQERNGYGKASTPLSATPEPPKTMALSQLDDFPCRTYKELQAALAGKKYSLGVDPLAAAEWSEAQGRGARKILVAALSVLLMVAALASIIVAIAIQNYWLLLALPIQAAVFYLSHANTSLSLWVTIGGGVSLLIFFDLLLNRLPTAATLVAYAGLTFAAVRAATSVNNSAFRRALANDEQLFITAYTNRACSLRDSKSKVVYEFAEGEEESQKSRV